MNSNIRKSSLIIQPESKDLAPRKRNPLIYNANSWLKMKQSFDGIDSNLWRINDNLYDFNEFAKKHPGGSDWITMTKGTDITEAFEVSHVFGVEDKQKILEKYFVRSCSNQPRKSFYTFEPNGFYMKLKSKVQKILKVVGTGPSVQMLILQDSLAIIFHILIILAIYYESFIIIIFSGLVLGMCITSAHNFWHKSDNFRQYYFDMSMLSSYEWKITHMISHHLHTNTFNDYEVAAMFPFLDFYPSLEKLSFHRYVGPIYYHLILSIVSLHAFLTRIIAIVMGQVKLRPENLIPFTQLIIIYVFSRWSFTTSFAMWMIMHALSGYWASFTTLISTHHHPSVYHAGDFHCQSKDWGVQQLDSNRDIKSKSLFMIATTLKNHTLHHLFPTVDHSKLHFLYPALEETCKEFNIDFQFEGHLEMFYGFHKSLMRITPQTFEQRLEIKNKRKMSLIN